MSIYKYYIMHKPYDVLSQFTDKLGRRTLASVFKFPPDVYAVGRLDMDSEGLLLLTNDKKITNLLLHPIHGHEREYLVQVEGIPAAEELKQLEEGVEISGSMTMPAKVKIVEHIDMPPRKPPIRFRKHIPTCWLSVTITEGKYRQVRKMTAKIGHPTLRLFRMRIENITLGSLKEGEVRELTEAELTGLYEKVS